MKIFERGGKINFVDENNVFVGYDMEQSCCEDADWFISTEIPKEIPELRHCERDLENYIFDKEFCEDNQLLGFAEGCSVVFRLIDKNNSELFLCLFNCHNGYYGHGFEMKIGDTEKKTGVL